jgi:antitoxin (DNA-binding transcriptional repressor) of toxin-antitoxin stability system
MKATIVDLRYRMKDVLRALDRGEDVSILYRGKLKGIIVAQSAGTKGRIDEHPFFNMRPWEASSIADEMDHLRGGRHFGATRTWISASSGPEPLESGERIVGRRRLS